MFNKFGDALVFIIIFKGLKFWKSPRRKLFAVSKLHIRGKSRKRHHDDVMVDSDIEEPINSKMLKETNSLVIIESKVDDMREDIESIKEAIQEIWHLNEKSKLPMGLQRIIRDAFQCKICLSVPINPPVIMSKCCKVIIGCEACVNGWYTGTEALTKTCPSCRIERGYSETMVLRGLDSFLDFARARAFTRHRELAITR